MRDNGPRARAAVRGYQDRFERRFVATGEEVLYLRADRTGARMGRERAAALIAAMRATLAEADGAALISAEDAGAVAIAAALGAVLLGAITDYLAAGMAMAVPAAAAVLLLGPGISAFRLRLAFERGLAAAEGAAACCEPVPPDELRRHAPLNVLRGVATVALVVTLAVLFGLVVGASTLPGTARVELDRLLWRALPPVVLVLVGLAFAGRLADLLFRRPVSEAEIEEAAAARRRRPFR